MAQLKKYQLGAPKPTHKYHIASTLSDAKVITILVLFHLKGYRCLKHFYLDYVCKHMRHIFPNTVPYSRFVTLQRSVMLPLTIFLKEVLLGKCTGITFVDSTPLRVCKPQRIPAHKVFREHNEKCHKLSGIDMAPATVVRYETSLKHTLEFMTHTYRKDDIYLDELSRQFIEDYEFYLKTEKKCCHNTTTKYLKNFTKIIRIALEKELLKKDPFVGVKFTLDDVDRDFLEAHEIQKVWSKEIKIERLVQVRDIFVFCAMTGLAFSDVKQLKQEYISININGKKWIRKARQKTKNMCNIPILDIAQQILERYKYHPECINGDLLPVPSNQKYNAYIKELAVICGINKEVSSHTARHSFASSVARANGVTIENVAKMLGHSDTKMTRHYAKVIDKSILRDMENVNEKFKLKKKKEE